MSLRNQIPAKLSARSVYSKQSAANERGRGRPKKDSSSTLKVKPMLASLETSKKGRGRPRKLSTSPVKVKSNSPKKTSLKPRKRKSSVSFKTTAEIIQNDSSEADLSSEGEETDPLSIKYPANKKNKKNSNKISNVESEVSHEEEGDESLEKEDEESENSDYDEAVSAENDLEEQEDNELADVDLLSTDENDELDSSQNDIRYSFPKDGKQISAINIVISSDEEDTNNNSETFEEKQNETDEIQFKKTMKSNNAAKRKVAQESSETSEEQNAVNSFKPKKKKKKLKRDNYPVEDSMKSFSTTANSRISFSPQHNFNQNCASTSAFHSPTVSPHPKIDSIESLIKQNKSAQCGNIAADQAFRWLISPILPSDFFHNTFEKMPCVVTRDNPHYFKDLFSGNALNLMLKEHNLEYGVHIDVVKYVKGNRIPVNADGRAYYSNVWEDYKHGYSLRIRNPQSYNKNLWKLCSLLQEYFSSSVGCNVYLTPPKAQGFPPHYDDVDAFIVQVEGRKHWKVYSPRYPEEELARYSSKDFNQNELGNPILQVCLSAGDTLYIPRGYIHQAATDGVNHSLHLTFSTNQLNTWGDLLLIAANKAIEKAILNDVIFRQSISRDYMDYIGSAVSDSKAFKRYEIMNQVKNLATQAMSYIDVDEASDLHSLKFMQTSLPPAYSKIEKERSIHGNGSYWKNGEIRLKASFKQDTEIQLIKKRNLRLVISDNCPRLYHNNENLRDPKPVTEEEPLATYVEFEMEAVPSYLFLLNRFPDFVKVRDLPLNDPDDKVSFAMSLYENGIIMTKEPLSHFRNDTFDQNSMYDEILVKN